MTQTWHFGDILEAIEAVIPAERPALIHGEHTVSWSDFARRSNNLASWLRENGAQPGDKLAFYMRNRTEYTEALAAAFKARLTHVNVNFRYLDDELWYILENSDSKFVVFDPEFLEHVEKLRDRLPRVEHWIQLGDSVADFATSYEAIATGGSGKPLGIERGPEDTLFLYTGGTTGMPKGVMWGLPDLWAALGAGASAPAHAGQAPATLEELVEAVAAFDGARQIPCCPLMHGTGLFTSITNILGGGTVVTLPGAKFDPVELFDTVDRAGVDSLVIVGDAFAKPMLRALDDDEGRWDLKSLKLIVSSGVMWSLEVKQGLLRHHPGLMLVDAFGSSEAVGFGSSVTTAAGETKTAKFQIGEKCKVFTEDHREVQPGSGEKGFIARCGPIPLGYYKDEEKSAQTFPTINGVRYSIPGDWCLVEPDGTLRLLGRGSACINSAGEKIFPEEVEEALKTHPDVDDALVVGVPDDKWGNAVVGVVQLAPSAALDEDKLRAWVRERIAAYKVPKRIYGVEAMFRASNGKADYKSAASFAAGQYQG